MPPINPGLEPLTRHACEPCRYRNIPPTWCRDAYLMIDVRRQNVRLKDLSARIVNVLEINVIIYQEAGLGLTVGGEEEQRKPD